MNQSIYTGRAPRSSMRTVDPEVYALTRNELHRQRNTLMLIPSESLAPLAVLEANGSVLNNKYAEGYSGKRFYGGQQYVDGVENLAISRAKEVFHADFANVQAHSGSGANMAAYFSVLQPGDKIMGLSLNSGGHLTHGSPVNFSGMMYNIAAFDVDPTTHRLDYDAISQLARVEKPKIIVAGFSAISREVDFQRFADIAHENGALLLADISHIAGLVAGGVHMSPFPGADIVTTTTHKSLGGPRGAMILTNNEAIAKKINSIVFPGIQGGPFMHAIAGKAVALKIALGDDFKIYAQNVVINAQALAESLISNGMTIVSGGTDNHLILVDLRNKDITGKVAQVALEEAGLVANRNTILYEPRTPFNPSGIRLGTPALTQRGMGTEEMREIGRMIAEICSAPGDETLKFAIGQQVLEMTNRFPLYPELGRV